MFQIKRSDCMNRHGDSRIKFILWIFRVCIFLISMIFASTRDPTWVAGKTNDGVYSNQMSLSLKGRIWTNGKKRRFSPVILILNMTFLPWVLAQILRAADSGPYCRVPLITNTRKSLRQNDILSKLGYDEVARKKLRDAFIQSISDFRISQCGLWTPKH